MISNELGLPLRQIASNSYERDLTVCSAQDLRDLSLAGGSPGPFPCRRYEAGRAQVSRAMVGLWQSVFAPRPRPRKIWRECRRREWSWKVLLPSLCPRYREARPHEHRRLGIRIRNTGPLEALPRRPPFTLQLRYWGRTPATTLAQWRGFPLGANRSGLATTRRASRRNPHHPTKTDRLADFQNRQGNTGRPEALSLW